MNLINVFQREDAADDNDGSESYQNGKIVIWWQIFNFHQSLRRFKEDRLLVAINVDANNDNDVA